MKAVLEFISVGVILAVIGFWAGQDYEKSKLVNALKEQELENKKTMGVTSDEVKILSARDVCIAIGGLPDEC